MYVENLTPDFNNVHTDLFMMSSVTKIVIYSYVRAPSTLILAMIESLHALVRRLSCTSIVVSFKCAQLWKYSGIMSTSIGINLSAGILPFFRNALILIFFFIGEFFPSRFFLRRFAIFVES